MDVLELKAFRKKFDLSQARLSKILNVAPVTVQKWEYGQNNMPKKYAELLKQYDLNGLPVSDSNYNNVVVSNNNNDCQKQVDNLNKQINDLIENEKNLIELLKEKDKQITMLLSKL